ncbi:hypothetical protein IW138_000025 [Coemansia sp. RSA 986]|nr:hypothetical protein IW138_000025 [Coemansia sp. RSA 986]
MSHTIFKITLFLSALALSAFGKVNIDVYMMSKCPDAVRGMKDLAAVYYDNLSNVDLRFNYIGDLNETSTYGVTCMHGDYEASINECFGNIQQLCVQEKLGTDAALQYVLCENRDIKRIGTYSKFAECLHTSTIAKWMSVARCTVSDEGKKLLQKNVADTKSKGMKTSLTFTLNGKQRCIFDSGHWVAPEDGCPGGGSVPDFSKSIQDELSN